MCINFIVLGTFHFVVLRDDKYLLPKRNEKDIEMTNVSSTFIDGGPHLLAEVL